MLPPHADPPMATPQIDTIDETDLRAVTRRIGEALPSVCTRHSGGSDGCQDLAAVHSAAAVAELHYRSELIGRHMGSLGLCRGSRGDALHEAGAVDATLSVLAALNRHEMLRAEAVTNSTCEVVTQTADENEMVRLPPIHGKSIICNNANDEKLSSSPQIDDTSGWTILDQAAIALASACLGSIRDLACGNASNRADISEYISEISPFCCTSTDPTTVTGPQILASYVKRYHLLHWEDILHLESENGCIGRGRKELRLLTDATGAIRNSSHSTPKTCAGLHLALVTEMFIWRLKEGSEQDGLESVSTTLPDSSRPWREASFRIAGSLINISERCSACAEFCGADLDLIHLLVEAWGGAAANTTAGAKGKKKQTSASTPMLHLGLAAILHAADAISPLDEALRSILAKEAARKEFARKKEAERQKRIAMGLK